MSTMKVLILVCGMLVFLFYFFPATPLEVFLSCTGDDIRKGFSDHLYTALTQAGIRTFREEDVPTGENVGLAIRTALHTSKKAVVVFSKDYAKCRACLDELVMIMDLVKINLLKLVPVYHNVHRMEVQEQTGPFYGPFASLERQLQLEGKIDIFEKYRKVVSEAGGIKGPTLMNGYESQFLDIVVGDVKAKQNAAPYFNWCNLLWVGVMLIIVLVIAGRQAKFSGKSTATRRAPRLD